MNEERDFEKFYLQEDPRGALIKNKLETMFLKKYSQRILYRQKIKKNFSKL